MIDTVRGLQVLHDITPVILTFNEAPNIGRSLECLRWAEDVLIVDSGSTDETIGIAKTYANVRVRSRSFDRHDAQWNFAIEDENIHTDWVLALDADYLVTASLVAELKTLSPADDVSGYRVRFRYCVGGRILRGSLYPPHVVLFRRTRGRYRQVGHTQRLLVDGRVEDLAGWIEHDDRKELAAWLTAQRRYARLEAQWLRSRRWAELRWIDRLRRMRVITPWLVPLYCLFVKGAAMDGAAGWRYAWQRSVAERYIARALWGRRILDAA